jgi:outer membrane protein W
VIGRVHWLHPVRARGHDRVVPTALKATAGLERVNGTADVNAVMCGVTLAYYLPDLGRIEPFVGIGVGGETVRCGNRGRGARPKMI